jgi:hypothetical protein
MVQKQHAFSQKLYARPSSIELKPSMKGPRYEHERVYDYERSSSRDNCPTDGEAR